MESSVGRASTLRSLVRPVSPLSRLNPPALPPFDLDSQSNRKVNNRRSRSHSRSPVLASTVFLANRSRPFPVAQHADETRRIVVHRPAETMDMHPEQTKQDRHIHSAITRQKSEENGLVRNMDHRGERHPKTVNRPTTCPILVRLSYSTNGRHHALSEYDKGRFPDNEIQINTWIDCSLKELAEEVRDVCPFARRRGTRLHFAVIYPDQRGTYRRRELGVVISGFINSEQAQTTEQDDSHPAARSFNLTDDSSITLLSKRFHIGDYIDVAICEHVPGSLGGWTTGRRPLGPTPVSSRAAANLI